MNQPTAPSLNSSTNSADPADGVYAAIDLGSNSFHMLVARHVDGTLQVIDRLREMVRLADAITDDGRLDDLGANRAIDCLMRFGERLRGLEASQVRAVGTNTLRRVGQTDGFLYRAEDALGFPIEVIGGHEEARLIYLGVSEDFGDARQKQLVIDIGGGSTEFIIGQGEETYQLESLEAGCVGITRRFFANGQYNRKSWEKARISVELKIAQIQAQYTATGWDTCIGSSGSFKAIAKVTQAMGLRASGIDLAAIETLREKLLEAGNLDKLDLPDLSSQRKPVFAGGLLVAEAAFRSLGIQSMQVSRSALREGLLRDMIGRSEDHDRRDLTVRQFIERWSLDGEQIKRVTESAAEILAQIEPHHRLNEQAEDWLRWALELHEIGLVISHEGHRKHGAYLLRHASMSGFSLLDQQVISFLVGNQRRRIDQFALDSLPQRLRPTLLVLLLVLRLSIIFNRARQHQSINGLTFTRLSAHGADLNFPRKNLQGAPLTQAELQREQHYFQRIGFTLEVAGLRRR